MVGSVLAPALRSALAVGLLTPLGLFAALAIVPLVALYLLRPDPTELELPTARFLHRERGRDKHAPAFETLPRSLLLLLQVLVIALLAASLATPYVPLAAEEPVEETVLVVDATGSMATESGGESRFSRAVDAARGEVGSDTTIVVAGERTRVAVEAASAEDATAALDGLRVNDARGDLGSAVDRAVSLAGEGARLVVLSDFAGETDWRTPLQVASARDLEVGVRQFGGGGDANVGIVDVAFSDGRVAATVRNYGDSEVQRTLSLGEASVDVTLAPNDTVSRSLPVPVNGSELTLDPGDSFATDDSVPIAAPAEPTIDVLLLSNREDRELETALSVVDTVNLTVASPPASVSGEYDLVVFGAVEPDSVLSGTVDAARQVLQNGGGVVVTAVENASAVGYGDLMLLEPDGVGTNATLSDEVEGSLARDISFPAPERYLEGELANGRSLVTTTGGAPVLARGTVDGGPVLFYNYLGTDTVFEYNYMYPVFWKRVATELSGWPSLAELNRETGTRLAVEAGTTVRGPERTFEVESVPLTSTGFYGVGDRQYAAALVDPVESNVRAPSIEETRSGLADDRVEERTAQVELSALGGVAAVLIVLLELAYLSRRGDL